MNTHHYIVAICCLMLSLLFAVAVPSVVHASVMAVTLAPGEQEAAEATFFTLSIIEERDDSVVFGLTANPEGFVGVWASLGATVREATQLVWDESGSGALSTQFEVPRAELVSTGLFVMGDHGLVGTLYTLELEAWYESISSSAEEVVPPGYITEAQCIERGGDWQIVPPRFDRSEGEMTEERIRCYFASPENGNTCSDSDECGRGRFWCSGFSEWAGPTPHEADSSLDGTEGTGICDDDRTLVDGYWYCLVEDGRIQVHGIIID